MKVVLAISALALPLFAEPAEALCTSTQGDPCLSKAEVSGISLLFIEDNHPMGWRAYRWQAFHGALCACGSALCASQKVMPILSSMLECMSYSTSCVGINLGACGTLGVSPRLIPPHSVGISPYVTRLPQSIVTLLISCHTRRPPVPFQATEKRYGRFYTSESPCFDYKERKVTTRIL